MRRGRVIVMGIATAIVVAFAAFYAGSPSSDRARQPLPEAAAIAGLLASRLDDADGQSHAFSLWQGKTLVVNFWATWCPPCREEMPAFSRLQERYAAQDVQFVGIALDTREQVRTFAAAHPVSYPLLIGGPTGVDLARQLGNTGLSLPYTLLIGADRRLRLVRLGTLPESELDLALQESLAR